MGSDANTHASNNPPARLTGAEIVWATLVGEGVTDVFGYPGGAILPVYDALRKFPIHHVLVRHEQGAAHMADGYARASARWELPSRPAAPAQLTWSPALPPPCWTQFPLSASPAMSPAKCWARMRFRKWILPA